MTTRPTSAPFDHNHSRLHLVMAQVLLALLPAIAVHAWQTQGAILIHIALASATALLSEAAILKLRQRPIRPVLADNSALITAWLIALCLPPLVPFWLTIAVTAIAIIFAKQIYGGLGQNPFNPAMIAFCIAIITWPALLSQHLPPFQASFTEQARIIFGLDPRSQLDALTAATALDALNAGLREANAQISQIIARAPAPTFASDARLWLALAYTLGGLYLIARRLIDWRTPLYFLLTLMLLSATAWLLNPERYPAPHIDLLYGGTLLAAFFILTDPVTGATTPRGKILFASACALIAWLIRLFGNFPDGIAFAVLLMNMCAPLIDLKTQPPIEGQPPATPPQP